MDKLNLLEIPYNYRSLTVAEFFKLQPQFNKPQDINFKKGDYIIYRHSNGVFIAQVDNYVLSCRQMKITGFQISYGSIGIYKNRIIYLQGYEWVKITEKQYQELEQRYKEIVLKAQCFKKKNVKHHDIAKQYEQPSLACQPNKLDIFTINTNYIQDIEKVTIEELYNNAEQEYETKNKHYQECYNLRRNYIGKTYIYDDKIMFITSVSQLNCGLVGDLIEITEIGIIYRSQIYLENFLLNSHECDSIDYQHYFSYINLARQFQTDVEINFFRSLKMYE